jgi:hypothetical protein
MHKAYTSDPENFNGETYINWFKIRDLSNDPKEVYFNLTKYNSN